MERGVAEGGGLEGAVVDGLAAGAGWTRCIPPPVIVGPGIGTIRCCFRAMERVMPVFVLL